MEIKKIKNKWQLKYKYKIITVKRQKKDRQYYFYQTHFSNELIEYFGTYEYYLYKYENKLFITTVKPTDYEYKKFKAQSKHNNSQIRSIPLNPKLCGLSGDETDKYIEIIMHLCEKDPVSNDVLVELKVIS